MHVDLGSYTLSAPTGPPLWSRFWENLELTQPLATVLSGAIVGLGAFLGFYAATKSRKAMESAALDTDIRERHTAQLVHGREVKSARQERYSRIAEQMASEHGHVRMAGIYALSALADEWQEDDEYRQRDACVELLCAYLRNKPRDGGDDEARGAVIVAIAQHTKLDAEYPWPGQIIDSADVDLTWTTLQGLDLTGASFRRADLSHAMILDCKLQACVFINTIFDKAQLQNVDLSGSALDASQAHGSYVIDANFDRASLWGMDLGRANLRAADLSRAEFGRIVSDNPKANVSLVVIDKAGSGAVSWDSSTLWPWWFDPEAAVKEQIAWHQR